MASCGWHAHYIADEVLTFRTKAWSSFAPPPCRMPLGQYQGIPRAGPGGWITPRFRHRLPFSTRRRRFACARLSRPCLPGSRPDVSATLTTTAFDRSSLQWLEACSRSPTSKDLPSSLVQLRIPFGPAMLVTHDPAQDSGRWPTEPLAPQENFDAFGDSLRWVPAILAPEEALASKRSLASPRREDDGMGTI